MIPSLWREELIHPLLAHFPVALIPVTLAFRAAAAALGDRPAFAFLLPASRTLMGVAVFVSWATMFTGEMAEDVVNKVICDPTVTQSHEDFARFTSIGITAAAALDAFGFWMRKRHPEFADRRWIAALPWTVVLILLGSTGALLQTGHLGASLVYQQGAGVYHPSTECKEFE